MGGTATTVVVMPRAPREWVTDGTYHVYSRGSNRQAIFRYDSDRIDLLGCLARAVRNYSLACLAYSLMPNHCHYLIQTTKGGLSEAMRELNGRYSRRFNKRYGLEAHLFRNRFGAVHQASDSQLMWTARYIVANPVEARLCAHASEWPWSSYRATAMLERSPPFLDVGALLTYFGNRSEEAVARYVEFVDGARTLVGV